MFRDKMRLFTDNPSGKEAGMGRRQHKERQEGEKNLLLELQVDQERSLRRMSVLPTRKPSVPKLNLVLEKALLDRAQNKI